MNDYNTQATDFLNNTNTEFTVEFIKNDFHFENDGVTRDIYKATFKRGARKFSVEFGQSVVNSAHYVQTMADGSTRKFGLNGNCISGNVRILDVSKYLNAYGTYDKLRPKLIKGITPVAYDILACLNKYDVGSFEDFCGEFNYDVDSRLAKKTYKAVTKEYNNVCKLWSVEELEILTDIC